MMTFGEGIGIMVLLSMLVGIGCVIIYNLITLQGLLEDILRQARKEARASELTRLLGKEGGTAAHRLISFLGEEKKHE